MNPSYNTDDIRYGVVRLAPRWSHPYILLARFDRPIGWWLLLLPSWQAIILAGNDARADFTTIIWLMLLFWIGAVVMRAAGCIINDLWDRDLDNKVERTRNRPLASGAISTTGAFVFLGLLGVVGISVLLALPSQAQLTGIASIPLIILYPLAKRFIALPQIILSLTFSWGALLGWAAHGSAPSIEAGLLYIASAFWVFGYDTIYALQDKDDDRKAGIKSSALTLGKHVKPVIAFCYAMMVALLILIGGMLALNLWWYACIGVAALHLGYQIRLLDAGDFSDAGMIFRSNRNTGLIITLAAALAYWL